MLLYDFQCPACGTVTEGFAKSNETEKTIECGNCGNPAKRIISPVRCKLEGVTGAFPGAYAKWDKVRQQKLAQEKKQAAEHGE